jgi:hypothetical protein
MSKQAPQGIFRTGQKIPESGIYQVSHEEHRLPHEVTLIRGAMFPRCSKCKEAVTFKAVALAPRLDELRERVTLYELPDIGDEHNAA